MKINFITGNKHKVEEAQSILDKYGIEVNQVKLEKIEPKDFDMEEVASSNALEFAKKLGKPVIVEDTGIFFESYPNFPGAHPKLMFDVLGYKGIMKLMIGVKNRKAEFRAVIAWSDGEKVETFVGSLFGRVTRKPYGMEKDVMPYERIIKVDDGKKAIAFMSREEKNRISHRAEAFKKLGEYLCR